jgi:hypothetical protein
MTRSGAGISPVAHVADQRWTSAPVRVDDLHRQRHLAQRVRGAREAGVERADGHLDVVEQASVGSWPSRYWRATWRIASFIAWLLCVVETMRLHIVTRSSRRPRSGG